MVKEGATAIAIEPMPDTSWRSNGLLVTVDVIVENGWCGYFYDSEVTPFADVQDPA